MTRETAPEKIKKNYAAQEIGRLRARVATLEASVKYYRDMVGRKDVALHAIEKRLRSYTKLEAP